jgi:hypothetical protein
MVIPLPTPGPLNIDTAKVLASALPVPKLETT